MSAIERSMMIVETGSSIGKVVKPKAPPYGTRSNGQTFVQEPRSFRWSTLHGHQRCFESKSERMFRGSGDGVRRAGRKLLRQQIERPPHYPSKTGGKSWIFQELHRIAQCLQVVVR